MVESRVSRHLRLGQNYSEKVFMNSDVSTVVSFVPPEEMYLEANPASFDDEVLVQVVHTKKGVNWGIPLVMVAHRNETIADFRRRLCEKLSAKVDEFNRWPIKLMTESSLIDVYTPDPPRCSPIPSMKHRSAYNDPAAEPMVVDSGEAEMKPLEDAPPVSVNDQNRLLGEVVADIFRDEDGLYPKAYIQAKLPRFYLEHSNPNPKQGYDLGIRIA